jgi:hypothetical protein
LEYLDFITPPEILFPSYYPNSAIKISIGGGRFFLADVYVNAMTEDIRGILYSFEYFLEENKRKGKNSKGWLKLTAIGMGFFADLPGYGSLTPIIQPLFIKATKHVLENYYPSFPLIEVIEFPNFSGTYKVPQIKFGTFKGTLVTTNKEDLLYMDHRHADFLVGLVNPSDVFSYKGNEFEYASVEAEIGNNTDIRYRQTALFNPGLLKKSSYIPLQF